MSYSFEQLIESVGSFEFDKNNVNQVQEYRAELDLKNEIRC